MRLFETLWDSCCTWHVKLTLHPTVACTLLTVALTSGGSEKNSISSPFLQNICLCFPKHFSWVNYEELTWGSSSHQKTIVFDKWSVTVARWREYDLQMLTSFVTIGSLFPEYHQLSTVQFHNWVIMFNLPTTVRNNMKKLEKYHFLIVFWWKLKSLLAQPYCSLASPLLTNPVFVIFDNK